MDKMEYTLLYAKILKKYIWKCHVEIIGSIQGYQQKARKADSHAAFKSIT